MQTSCWKIQRMGAMYEAIWFNDLIRTFISQIGIPELGKHMNNELPKMGYRYFIDSIMALHQVVQ